MIFISYSHLDKVWLERLLRMLKPLERKGDIRLWADTLISPGAKWNEEISKALSSANVAVLLVSPNFLASDFIAEHELLPLLNAASKKGLTILWIALSHCLYKETELADYQAVNDPDRPLDSLPEHEINRVLADICVKIKRAVTPRHTHH
jgi:internalin A